MMSLLIYLEMGNYFIPKALVWDKFEVSRFAGFRCAQRSSQLKVLLVSTLYELRMSNYLIPQALVR